MEQDACRRDRFAAHRKDYIAGEIFGNRALRQGDWKLRWQYKPFGKGDWELFNLASDPAERVDQATQLS